MQMSEYGQLKGILIAGRYFKDLNKLSILLGILF